MQHVKVQKFDASQSLRFKATLSISTVLLAVSLVPLASAQKASEQTFPSAEAASHALFVAVQSDSDQALAQILGGGTELVATDDQAQDKLEREHFGKKYEEMHRLVREPDGTTVLYVGAENWPFPVPLVAKDGAWHFDGASGKQEVLFRRIGENEATAIETCHALVLSKQRRETATTGDDPINRYAQTLVTAGASDEESPTPFHGYYFRMLRGQSKNGSAGFAFVAYPAEYRSSGVMTFVVTQDNVVYKKDIGPDTAKLAKKMAAGRPSSSWHPAE